ncbi:hypothetical protein VNO77_22648 [Canavalia gladiata]|uniref:Uncharacterized protein n=1 Tax=Canavalia gladiata TaxID=3824 RepID=A0AAN9L881_CANGL
MGERCFSSFLRGRRILGVSPASKGKLSLTPRISSQAQFKEIDNETPRNDTRPLGRRAKLLLCFHLIDLDFNLAR